MAKSVVLVSWMMMKMKEYLNVEVNTFSAVDIGMEKLLTTF